MRYDQTMPPHLETSTSPQPWAEVSRRCQFLWTPSGAGVLIALLSICMQTACTPQVSAPSQGLAVLIKAPLLDNPFDDPNTAFVALVAEGPDLKPDTLTDIQPYTPTLPLTLPEVPYGYARQIRVDIYSKDVNGQPALPVIGRGRTVPKDVRQGETFLVHAYVTKTNAFTPPINNKKIEMVTDARVGAAFVGPDTTSVLIAGGASPVAGKTDPYDPASWGAFKSSILRYDVDQRQLFDLSKPPTSTSLSVGRAFMASAVGSGGSVVFSGGYVDPGTGPVITNLMEYFDPESQQARMSSAAKKHLKFARAHHTVTRMFDDDNYFMIIGGKGKTADAANTWEIWHPAHGQITEGRLSGPRWNHRTVRLPAAEGGFMMLIGGENDAGTLNTFEVLRYDRFGNVAFKGNTKVTCCLGGTCYRDDKSNDKCAALADQKGYDGRSWEPLLKELKDNIGRTLPAVAYVSHSKPDYNLVYIVGGFSDKKKTQPLSRVDVFNISTGLWVRSTDDLLQARGGALLGWSTVGAQRGQVIVTGGLDADGKTVATGELLSYDPDVDQSLPEGAKPPPDPGKVLRQWSSNTLPGGGLVFGQAVSLSTGQIFIAGGASSDGKELKASTTIRLYNPR